MNETPDKNDQDPGAPRRDDAPFGGAPVEQPPRPRSQQQAQARPAAPAQAPPPRRGPHWGLIGCLVVGGLMLFGLMLLLGFALSFVGGMDFTAPNLPPLGAGSSTVGVLRVVGPIYDARESLEILEHYRKNDEIKAILVRVDSPGGAVGASQELYAALTRLREEGRKVVVSMGNVAGSGGYYLAAAADEIVANPGTLTGSIGVIMSLPNFKQVNEKIGLEFRVIKSGQFKDIGSVTRDLTEDERRLLEDMISDTYEQFLEDILAERAERIEAARQALASGRPDAPLPYDLRGQAAQSADAEAFLRRFADGRLLTGRQAEALGLVDTLGDERVALERLADLAGIDKPRKYEWKPKQTLQDLLSAQAGTALDRVGLGRLEGLKLEYRIPY